jgi:hypothetical protein
MNFFRMLAARLRRRPRRGRATAGAESRRATRARQRRERAETQSIRHRPGLGPLPPGRTLVAAARARGTAFAKSGGIDEWLFSDDFVLPYLAELRSLRDLALDETRRRGTELSRWDQAEHDRDYSEAVGLRIREESLNHDRGTALAHLRSAWARLNWQAQLDAQGQVSAPKLEDLGIAADEPDGDEAEPDLTDTDTEAEADTSTEPQASEENEAPTDDPFETAMDIALAPAIPVPAAGADRWEGSHGSRISGWWTAAILGGLIAVEVPIQFVIFKTFQGYGTLEEAVLTWVFTIPVSAVMVLLPHLSGSLYRSRRATGSDGLMRLLPLLLLLPWAYIACTLGYLRARVLLTATKLVSANSSQISVTIPAPGQTLHVTPTTMTIMFIALLLGVGGVGFLLGLAREHPLIGAYTGADRAQRHLAAQLSEIAPAAELARQQAESSERSAELTEQQLAHRLNAIRASYAAAEHAYLDAIANTAKSPAISEAIAGLSARISAAEPSGETPGEAAHEPADQTAHEPADQTAHDRAAQPAG